MSFKIAASNLSLRQLRAFLAVAQESSMTRAADKLHLTPSALSMLVRGMEDDLGVRLFDRTTRRLVLTEAGQQFLPTVEQVFAQLEAGIALLQDTQHVKAGRLRVAASPLLASALFPKVIASFRLQNPHIKVTLMDASVESLPDLVRRGDVDMAVCTASSDTADLLATPVYTDKLMLICPSSHRLALRREVEWQDLLSEPLILMRQGSGLRTLVDKAFAKWNKHLQPAYEVSQVATALGLVSEGEGVSVLPSYAISRAQNLSQVSAVATVDLVSPIVSREIVALTKEGSEMTSAALRFVEQFKNHAV
ncbi:LysR family transcriptional regulator [Limnohabitans sp.]|jgi:LysR family carnitine catabolism transcriptional activator|uniref:LysR family transcriptional regulator n=1 Tax=Limnohabitans sp. TaxID=1907725 RepID=UPI00286ED930|nr:LysR family transcriptional regulator [Limnohabitans sp.]